MPFCNFCKNLKNVIDSMVLGRIENFETIAFKPKIT